MNVDQATDGLVLNGPAIGKEASLFRPERHAWMNAGGTYRRDQTGEEGDDRENARGDQKREEIARVDPKELTRDRPSRDRGNDSAETEADGNLCADLAHDE